MEENNNINLYEYNYKQGEEVQMPGSFLYALLHFLKNVRERETYTGLTSTYSLKGKEVKNKDNKDFVETIELESKPYPTASSWFNQQPQEVTTMLGAAAEDLLLLVQQAHLQNIEEGKAIKLGEFEEEKITL